MAREAREKKIFSTYYIKQTGTLEISLFSNDDDRIKFMEILKKAKSTFDFKLYAYNVVSRNYYELIIFDNGSDISSIMKSINISYSIYKKTSGKLFRDRYESDIISDYYTLAKNINEIHLLGENKKWNSCSNYFKKDSSSSFLDIAEIRKLFNCEDINSFEEYKDSIENILSDENFLCNKDFLLCKESVNCIKTKEEGKKKLDLILREKNYTYSELLKNLDERNDLIKYFRKNSILNLKDIGSLFGGLSESTICKILNK